MMRRLELARSVKRIATSGASEVAIACQGAHTRFKSTAGLQLNDITTTRNGGRQTHDKEVRQGRAVDTARFPEGQQVLPC